LDKPLLDAVADEGGEEGRERAREDRERERSLLTVKKVGKHNALSGNTASGRTGSSMDG
jgi:hypothetical protein